MWGDKRVGCGVTREWDDVGDDKRVGCGQG